MKLLTFRHYNNSTTIGLSILLSIISFSLCCAQSQLAFPTATGAGAYASGGRGKPVYVVTNLNNSGEGSFRQALENTRNTDGGIITFAVSGTIVLTTKLDFRDQGNITIAGQTSPEGGITIVGANANARLEFQNMSNFIIRYVRFRPNYPEYPQTEQDALYLYNCSHYIIDHCSISWGTDENADTGNGNNYTWQRNLFAESNKTGMIMGAEVEDSYNMSFVKNAFYNCSHRFPNWQSNGRVDIINNVIWGYRGLISSPLGTFNVNHIGNYYRYFRDYPVAETYKRMMYYYYPSQGNEMPSIYTSGNYVSGVLTDPDADNWMLWRWRFNPSGSIYSGAGDDSPLPVDLRQTTPFDLLGEPFEISSFTDAFEDVTDDIGANARLDEYGNKITEIDALDSIYITNMQNQILVDWTQDDILNTSHRLDFVNSISTSPVNIHPEDFDTNNDGIPDQWVLSKGFNILDDLTTYVWSSGYVGIEEYLNEIDYQETGNNVENHIIVSSDVVDNTICIGQEIVLTATGAQSYLWTPGNISEESILVAPEFTTTYEVEGVHQDGSVTSSSITIIVNQLPEANAGEDQNICQGEFVILTATGGENYVWNTGEVSQTISVSPFQTTTYTVEVVENGCSTYDDVTVFVNPLPETQTNEDVTINLGENATLTAFGADSYIWSTGETSSIINVSPIETTTYLVTGRNGSCESTDSVTVYVINEEEVIANAGDDQTICLGDTVTLVASGGETYLWSTGETSQSIQVSPTITTTYTVEVFDSTGEHSDSDDVVITVNQIPNADAGPDLSICEGEQVMLSASGGSHFIWSTGEETQEITVSPNVTTTYAVEVSNGICSSTDEIIVMVNSLPEVDAGNDVTITEGESVTLYVSGAESYSWSTGETTSSITVSPQGTTTYEVVGTLNNCEASDTVTVYVDSEQEEPLANAGEDEVICQGQAVTLTASGGEHYLWNTGETTQSIIVSPEVTTTYTVVAYLGNQQDEDDVTVVVNPNPNIVINNNQNITILQGEYVTLSASGANEYLWNNGATEPNIAVNPSQTTTYSVIGYIGNCMDEKYVTVNVLDNIEAEIHAETEIICLGESITLTASGGDEYYWSNGETTPVITVTPEENTTYWVEVSNDLSSVQTSINIEVQDCSIIEEIPEELEFDALVFHDSSENLLKIKIFGFNTVNVKSVSIYDISGRFIAEYFFDSSQETVVTKEISSVTFSKGVYIVKLIYNTNILTKKILVY